MHMKTHYSLVKSCNYMEEEKEKVIKTKSEKSIMHTNIENVCPSRGGCTYNSGRSNEPLTNYIYIYIYIYIYCFTNLNHVLNLVHPDHISVYPTIKQQFSVLFMYG